MRVFSGIQPTGTIHIGNYFGALINWLKMQNEGHECFFSIVNQHAITLPQAPGVLEKNTLETAATLLAIGLDPKRCTIFLQSDVPAHSQLAWVLNSLAPMGQMERMIQYKEKAQKDQDALNLGLFSYPVLMAADIMLYKAEIVPVGIDQAQHLELTKLLVKKFNQRYKPIFPEPSTLHSKTTKIVGLDGTEKMSKSRNNYIGLVEDEKTVWEKLRVAATDPARITKKDAGNPYICNIYSLHTIFSSKQDVEWVIDGCKNAKIGCVDCKGRLFENINSFLKPIRRRYTELMSDPTKIKKVLKDGALRAEKVAQDTLKDVYKSVGFTY